MNEREPTSVGSLLRRVVGSAMPTDPRAALAGAGTLTVAVIAFYASVPVTLIGRPASIRTTLGCPRGAMNADGD